MWSRELISLSRDSRPSGACHWDGFGKLFSETNDFVLHETWTCRPAIHRMLFNSRFGVLWFVCFAGFWLLTYEKSSVSLACIFDAVFQRSSRMRSIEPFKVFLDFKLYRLMWKRCSECCYKIQVCPKFTVWRHLVWEPELANDKCCKDLSNQRSRQWPRSVLKQLICFRSLSWYR